MRAIYNGQVIAESNETVVVEGNHYFPAESLNRAFLRESPSTSECSWKGTANYYNLEVDGQVNSDAAWYYAEPKPEAAQIRGRIAFWRGAQVTE